MAELRGENELGGQDQGLGFECDSSPDFKADKTFWAVANAAIRGVCLDRPASPGVLRLTGVGLKLPGMPLSVNGVYQGTEVQLGRKWVGIESGLASYWGGLTDFLESERLVAEGANIHPDAVVLGNWHMMAEASVHSPEGDSLWQWARLRMHLYLSRTKCTSERYASVELDRDLPVPSSVKQSLTVRVRTERSRTQIDGPSNTVSLSGFKGRGVYQNLLEVLGHYDEAFRPDVPLGLLTLDQWQDAIETPLSISSLLRMRRGQS